MPPKPDDDRQCRNAGSDADQPCPDKVHTDDPEDLGLQDNVERADLHEAFVGGRPSAR